MSNEVISAEQIEGLEELITEVLNRKINQIPLGVEDMEQLKKSPAGAIIRLEERVKALDEKIDEIRTQMTEIRTQMVTKAEFTIMSNRIDSIESKMATKQDLERMATKEELYALTQEVKALAIRIEEQGKRLSFFQTVTYSFLGLLFVMMAGILVKLFLP